MRVRPALAAGVQRRNDAEASKQAQRKLEAGALRNRRGLAGTDEAPCTLASPPPDLIDIGELVELAVTEE